VEQFRFADQYATKVQSVSKGMLGIGLVRRKVTSRPEATSALNAIKNSIERAAAQSTSATKM